MKVNLGNIVRVHYRGTFENGEEFDSSFEREPLEFTTGEGMMIPGFEKAVLDMQIGEKKNIVLPPADAYGDFDPSLVIKVPREGFPEEVNAGETILVSMENDQQMPMQVLSKNDNEVELDANHSLAGKTLHFAIEVIEIIP